MRFSEYEVSELGKAWAAISFAFAIVWSNGRIGSDFGFVFLLSALTVGIAFILHELAHKYVAQRFGCWAEFRSYNMGLMLAIGMSFFGFVFAAPGAVVISGLVTNEENGKIAVAGPVTNLVLAALFYLVVQLYPQATLHPFLNEFLAGGYRVNAWLAFFNLIPFGPLDGVKVMSWSREIWLVLVAVAAVLTFVVA